MKSTFVTSGVNHFFLGGGRGGGSAKFIPHKEGAKLQARERRFSTPTQNSDGKLREMSA